ncbi:hypothetical protein ACRZ5O_17555 [Pseudomonas protegens]|uniref:hypothetical protein n=1 Tax=Pseudomonas protegens TaxID=380021 RepID=UPI002ACC8DB6|nr:hypothetical protein [Pseudomonas putida]HEN8719817.1 hypothetical protein [Pseudomonas putida]
MKNAIKIALAALVLSVTTGCAGLADKYEAHVDRLNEKHANDDRYESYIHGSNWHYYDTTSPYAYAIGS